MACPRAVLAASVIALWLAVAPASAGTRASPGCNVETSYTVQVDAEGLRFDAAGDVSPRRVEIHDGGLRLDGTARPVSAADAVRLREIESGTRALLPEIAAVAREAIHLGFDALGGVHAALGGDRRRARDIEALRQRALLRVDQTLGRGTWHHDSLGAAFEAELAAAASEVAATVTPARAVWMAFSGGAGRMERRMEAMEADLERQATVREQAIEAHAGALCARLERLHGLQESLELRLDDGRPLRLFEYDADAPDPDAPATLDVNGERAPPR
ncbi:DUF2884 family protein [Luteimonas yindakuii]|uniref:DUF2884 family protein n=1 Tax=Luteimonas yindakuii TaxID=2565782 RepID=UPI0010A410CE|nr:DUF2884 family protein [Luteimonas yindakuii]QCO68415.1 DUF2884 family protein [Luteimonas yindakuii]